MESRYTAGEAATCRIYVLYKSVTLKHRTASENLIFRSISEQPQQTVSSKTSLSLWRMHVHLHPVEVNTNGSFVGYAPRNVAETDSVKLHLTCCELQVLRVFSIFHLWPRGANQEKRGGEMTSCCNYPKQEQNNGSLTSNKDSDYIRGHNQTH